MNYVIYTDGSSKNNGTKNNVGGWAYAIYREGSDELVHYNCGAVPDTTNNQMELAAMIEGINYIINNLNDFELVSVCTDSAYIYNCWKDEWYVNWVKNNWKKSDKKPVLNQTFWEALIPFFTDRRFWWVKVKGHATNAKNNFVDQLAQNAASDYKEQIKGVNLW